MSSYGGSPICSLFKLPVESGTAEAGQVTGDSSGAVGREGRSEWAKVEGAFQGPIQPHVAEITRRYRDASAP